MATTSLQAPQNRPVDVVNQDFQNWYNEKTSSLWQFSSTHNQLLVRRRMIGRGDDVTSEELEPRPTLSPIPTLSPELTNFHAYVNSRPNVDWNTCGQAAIASMLDYHGRDPFGLPRVNSGADGRMHWDDGTVIDNLINAGWGPDVIFGFGTTGGRISDALRYYGLNQNYVEYSGLFSAGWVELWDKLKYFLRVLETPVPVLVDIGALGGDWYTAHWPIAYRIGSSDEVYLANCPWSPIVDRDTFLRAWHCHFLPLGFNHCAVYYWGPWG